MLDRRAHAGGGAFRPQRQVLAIERVLEGVHLLLDDVGDFADGALEQGRRLDDGHADRAIAIALEPIAHDVFEVFPGFGVVGQDVIHPAHSLQGLAHGCLVLSFLRRCAVVLLKDGAQPPFFTYLVAT